MGVDTRCVVLNLTQNYYPFTLLSIERAREALSAVRVFELRANDTLTTRGGKGRDYLFVLSGAIEIKHVFEEAFVHAEDTKVKPLFIPPAPYTVDIKVKEDAVICHADSAMFDHLFLWQEIASTLEPEEFDILERMRGIRNTLAFRSVPSELLAEAFHRMQVINAKKGDVIFKQGDISDMFYVIKSGGIEVWREVEAGKPSKKVGVFGAGDVFGEDTLVNVTPRKGTVVMSEDGTLLALDRNEYLAMMMTNNVREVDADAAKGLIENGFELIDVRYQMERDESFIPGSIFIPLHDLREKRNELSKDKEYIIYCRSGKRSKAGAHLLNRWGFEAVSLQGGILGWPFDMEGDTF